MLKPSLQIHNVDGVLVGEFWDCYRLDPQPVKDLRTKYEEHIRGKGHPVVVIDLLGVGFAGSAALGNFVALHRLARQNGGGLIFCNVDPTVFEVFRVSKLDPLFSFVADRAKGLELAAKQLSSESGESPALAGPEAPPSDAVKPPKSGGNGLRRSNLRRKLS
jgi:anti-anti-sigma factor